MDLPLDASQPRVIEGIVVLTTSSVFFRMLRSHFSISAQANKQAGPIVTRPSDLIGKFATPTHFFAQMCTPIAYVVTVLLNGFVQPNWMKAYALPESYDAAVGSGGKTLLRIAACGGLLLSFKAMRWTFYHLGAQWHWIGIRKERKTIVSTGPYKYVRHSLYTIFLSQQLFLAVMFWSYTPLIAFGVAATTVALKMPVEERLIEKSSDGGAEYAEYKRKVTSRIFPYIW